MAISSTAAVPMVAETSLFTNSNHTRLSSLQFTSDLRISRFSNRYLKSQRRRPTLAPVASKKQTFTSFDELLENSDKPVLVDFYATWCGPCQFMVPILDQVGDSMIDKIQIVKIDTEKYPVIANKYKIEALPTFILFKNGEPCDRFEGAMGADPLIKRIEASLQAEQ